MASHALDRGPAHSYCSAKPTVETRQCNRLTAVDPTDQELESVLAKLRESVDGMSADELTDAIEKLEHDEAAGQISRRHLLEASVICAVILLHRGRQ